MKIGLRAEPIIYRATYPGSARRPSLLASISAGPRVGDASHVYPKHCMTSTSWAADTSTPPSTATAHESNDDEDDEAADVAIAGVVVVVVAGVAGLDVM